MKLIITEVNQQQDKQQANGLDKEQANDQQQANGLDKEQANDQQQTNGLGFNQQINNGLGLDQQVSELACLNHSTAPMDSHVTNNGALMYVVMLYIMYMYIIIIESLDSDSAVILSVKISLLATRYMVRFVLVV